MPKTEKIPSDMKWISVDPGETAGWTLWEGETWVDAGMEPLWSFASAVFTAVFEDSEVIPLLDDELVSKFHGIQMIVCEDFRLYPFEAKSGALDWDQFRTVRLIGALHLIAKMGGLKFELQPAKIKAEAMAAGAKAFFLKPVYENRHANDATMHGVFYIAVSNGAKAVQGNVSMREREASDASS